MSGGNNPAESKTVVALPQIGGAVVAFWTIIDTTARVPMVNIKQEGLNARASGLHPSQPMASFAPQPAPRSSLSPKKKVTRAYDNSLAGKQSRSPEKKIKPESSLGKRTFEEAGFDEGPSRWKPFAREQPAEPDFASKPTPRPSLSPEKKVTRAYIDSLAGKQSRSPETKTKPERSTGKRKSDEAGFMDEGSARANLAAWKQRPEAELSPFISRYVRRIKKRFPDTDLCYTTVSGGEAYWCCLDCPESPIDAFPNLDAKGRAIQTHIKTARHQAAVQRRRNVNNPVSMAAGPMTVTSDKPGSLAMKAVLHASTLSQTPAKSVEFGNLWSPSPILPAPNGGASFGSPFHPQQNATPLIGGNPNVKQNSSVSALGSSYQGSKGSSYSSQHTNQLTPSKAQKKPSPRKSPWRFDIFDDVLEDFKAEYPRASLIAIRSIVTGPSIYCKDCGFATKEHTFATALSVKAFEQDLNALEDHLRSRQHMANYKKNLKSAGGNNHFVSGLQMK